jgi:hypothetical protein
MNVDLVMNYARGEDVNEREAFVSHDASAQPFCHLTTWKIIGSASEDSPDDPTPSGVESDVMTLFFFGQFPRRAALAALDLSPALQGGLFPSCVIF